MKMQSLTDKIRIFLFLQIFLQLLSRIVCILTLQILRNSSTPHMNGMTKSDFFQIKLSHVSEVL